MSVLKNSILIHKHSAGCGGIGDFIRASLSLYSYCKRKNIEYYINLDENIFLKQCFEIKNYNININNDNDIECFSLLRGIYRRSEFEVIFDKIINNKKIYYIKTNAIGFESVKYIQEVREDYFNNILKPSSLVNLKINSLFDKYNLSNNNFICVHIRCGDFNMENRINDSKDKRVDLDDTNIYKYYNNIINEFYKKHGEGLKIVLNSDTHIFKNNLKELNNNIITLDIEIKHVAEEIGIDNLESFVSTIAEFYIISKANKIFMPYTYSGFSHIASIIEAKPLYTYNNSGYFIYLNANNIKKLK